MANTPFTQEEIRQKLLNAAKSLFLEYGIAGTEMKMIAERSGLSRSTLYRYTTDKNQLAFMVSIAILTDYAEKSLDIPMLPNATGFDKLQAFSRRMVDILAEDPSITRFFGEFDKIYTGEYPDIPEAHEYADMMNRIVSRDAQFLFEGMADGSILPLEQPLLFISVLTNTILGLAERMLPRDEHYRREHRSSGREILDETIRILLASVKAP